MKKRYGEIVLRMSGAALAALLVMALSGFAFRGIASVEEEKCQQVLADSAASINNEIQIRLSDHTNILKLVSAVAEHEAGHSADVLASHTGAFQGMTIFSRIDILYPDGTLEFQSGERQDVSDVLDFEAISAAGEQVSDCMIDLSDQKTRVVHCYVPVVQEGQTTAVLVGVIDCAALSDTFDTPAYDGKTTICIVDRSDGALLMDEWDCNVTNFFEIQLPATDEDAESTDALIRALKAGETGSVVFPYGAGETDSYVYYTPVGYSDWQLMIAVPEYAAFSSLIRIRGILTIAGAMEVLFLFLYCAGTFVKANRLAKQKVEAERQLLTSNTLIDCIRMLSEQPDADIAINDLLQIVNNYFDGDRTYLFEIDYQAETTNNTYEYAAEGVTKEIDNLQNVPLSSIQSWLTKFHETGTFCISDLDDDVDKDSNTYEILLAQNIHRLIAVPLTKGDVIIGFFGVDNPKRNYHDFSLISSATYFLMDNLEKRRKQQILERLSFEDNLTKLYNRNKFNQVVETCADKHPRQLGVAFFDLNGLKAMNDRHGHAAGDKLIRDAAKAIRYVFGENAFRIGGDEFAVIVTGMMLEPFNHDVKKACRMMRENDVSISVGWSWRSVDNDIAEQLREADERMYEDKKRFYETSGIDRRNRKRSAE